MTINELTAKLAGIRNNKRMRDIYYWPSSPRVKALCDEIDILLAIVDGDEFQAWEQRKQDAEIGRLSTEVWSMSKNTGDGP